jgi:hypothetical protein
LNPIEFQDAIQEARRNRSRFTLYIQDHGEPLLKDFPDCVITNFSPTVSIYSDTLTVDLTFEQVFVSQSARVSYLAPKPTEEDKPSLETTKDGGQATKTEDRTIALSIKSFFSPEEIVNAADN